MSSKHSKQSRHSKQLSGRTPSDSVKDMISEFGQSPQQPAPFVFQNCSSAEIKEMFQSQHQMLQGYEQTIQSLRVFKEHIQKGLEQGIFDKEENDWVDVELERINNLKKTCQDDLTRKEDIYMNSILKLENLLEQRRIAIEKAEKESCVFEQCPRLLQRFAEKRANLMKLVDKGKQDLQSQP